MSSPRTDPVKRKWSKPVVVGEKSSCTSGLKATAITIHLLHASLFAHATSVGRLKTNSLPAIGPANTFGQAKEEALNPPHHHAEVNTKHHVGFHYFELG